MDNAFNLIFNRKEVMLAIQAGRNFDAKPALLMSNDFGIELVCSSDVRVKPIDFRMEDIDETKELSFDISLKDFHQHLSESEAENFSIYLRFQANGKISFNITWL